MEHDRGPDTLTPFKAVEPLASALRPAGRLLRLLHLEDSPDDHELVVMTLRRGGLTFQTLRVDTRRAFLAALDEPWDAILSDYNIPGYSGITALADVRAAGIDLPFVLISGEIGEDTAVDAMRNGASDYLLKQNLARLPPALERALEMAQAQRERRAADLRLAESRERLSALAQHLQTSIEAERAAIAREIHDDVGGSLTALKFDLAWIDRHAVNPDVRARVRSAMEMVAHAIEASQRVMHNLRPAILEQGLVAALQWLAERFERRTGIPTEFRTNRDALALPPLVPLVAYRTVQEALTNVSKHAQASRASVDVSLAHGVLSVEITDNGRGLGRGDLNKARSFGLRGLRERAQAVGGWIELSSDSKGTTLLLSVPLEEAQAMMQAPSHGVYDSAHDASGWGTL